MTFIGKRVRGECAKGSLEQVIGGEVPPPPSTGGPITITAPVGIRGTNRPNDTVTIQDALNRVPAIQGGASPPLGVDGLCGPKTQRAIQVFQLKHFGWSGADGLVEPGRQTIGKLNEILTPVVAARPSAGTSQASGAPASMPDMTQGLRRTREFISAANHNLTMAGLALGVGPFVPTGFVREIRLRALNRHFSIDKFSDKLRAWGIIQKVFFDMGQVFQRPGGLWGSFIFEPDPVSNKNDYAYTSMGGFLKGGQFRFFKGHKIRVDTVYMCSSFNELKLIDHQAFVIVHELAHFVGHPEFIDDHAYNFQGAKMKKLFRNLKLLNAENYCNFAWDVSHQGASPPF